MAALDHHRFVPYPQAYEHQAEAMDRIRAALDEGRTTLFEGACGTGKTLAALAPALAHARETDRTVVITTNVHQQMRQFVEEARAINEAEPLEAVVFRGKASMCHIDVGFEECQVLRDTVRDRVDAEQDRRELAAREETLLEQARAGDDDAAAARGAVVDELQAVEDELEELEDRAGCDRFYRNLVEDTGEFERWLFDGVRTPDEIYERAGEQGYCGYELLKAAMDEVDLVVCNYHHLLDPTIRRQFFRWLGREPEEVVCVFDEAHNVEAAAREHATRTLTEHTLDGALEELRDAGDGRARDARNVIEAFRDALVDCYDRRLGPGEGAAVDADWVDVPVDNADRRDDLLLAFLDRYEGRGIEPDLEAALELGRTLDERYETAYREGDASTRRESSTLAAAAFVAAYVDEGADPSQYPVVAVRRDDRNGELYGRAELYACLPRAVTRQLFDAVHASVLMSATLRPFDVTADVLGLEEPETMAFGLTFPRERRRTLAVDTPPLFARNRDDPEVQAEVAGALSDAVAFTPGNTLVFFPSYGEAERYRELVDLDGPVYLDRPGERVEPLRERFVEADGAALFTSLWGTLAEGVSFDGDDATTVVVVGVPYPHLDDRLDAVQAAYADAFGGDRPAGTGFATATDPPTAEPGADPGWEYAVEIPTVRKTRQALGRALRGPEEVGARVLLDRRYTAADMGKYSVRGTFPPDERDELLDVRPEKLRYALLNFFTEHDAYGDDVPVPEP
ncbi:MAG: ATP-dependent DNA helicase [Halobacteriales archaeon]|nr:ATP-dependent DNA helicase [Halobacteriales archaeon]